MKVPPSTKYQLIYEMTNQPENALSGSKLCEISCVSRSGYYDWISNGGREKNGIRRTVGTMHSRRVFPDI